jgi:hypothetical protein
MPPASVRQRCAQTLHHRAEPARALRFTRPEVEPASAYGPYGRAEVQGRWHGKVMLKLVQTARDDDEARRRRG